MHTRSWFFASYTLVICALTVIFTFCALPGYAEGDDVMMLAPKDNDTCLQCHAQNVDAHKFAPSAHGKLSCQDCHTGIDRYPHPEKALAKKPDCATCHSDKAQGLANSVHAHARLKSGASVNCQSCHGGNPHEIVKPSSLNVKQREASCRTCHADNARMLSESVHGTNGKHTGITPPDCLACHGGGNPHAIKPPATSAEQQNTLCLKCHPVNSAQMLANAHGKALGNPDKRLKCLACHGGNPHAIGPPMQITNREKNSLCESCHTENAALLANSAHGNTNMEGGNRPNCLYCHGDKFHAITPPSQMAPAQKDAACKSCHADIAQRLSGSVHGQAAATPGKPTPGCLSCHGGGNPHNVIPPAKLDRAQKQDACERCHSDLAKSLKDSVHNRPDKVPGDHPTCLTCHGNDPHGIQSAPRLTPLQKVALCARCHADAARMARYGRTDAVAAYSQTFHGRAILQFHQTKEATCVDCHGLHGIQAPDKPDAPTNPRHASEICGKCHKGNNMTFAYSYASHQRLQVDKSLITPLEALFFTLIKASAPVYSLIMFVLGVVVVQTKRRKVARLLWLYDGYYAVALAGLLLALLAIVTTYSMHLLKESSAPQSTFVSSVALLVSAVTFIVLGLFVVPRKSSLPDDESQQTPFDTTT